MHSIIDYLSKLQAPDFDQIAPKLRAKPHHVLWNPELRPDGSMEKPLYRARPHLYHGKRYRASSTNPASWATFAQARKAYERGGYAGIGRAFTEDEYIIFLDYDHCIIDQATRTPNPIVREILDEIQTYSEQSPTDGAHAYIICKELPPNLKTVYHYKGQKIEVYWTARYSTLTGHRIPGTPPDVEERQAAFFALVERWEKWEEENTSCVCVCVPGDDQGQPGAGTSDEQTAARPVAKPRRSQRQGDQAQRSAPPIREADLPREDQAVLLKARTARNAATFTELWEGRDPKDRRKPSGEPDPSPADFDLALILLYWTNDNPDQAERLFRASGRYRDDKTDRVANRRGQSYIQHTIDGALKKRGKARRAPAPSDPPPTASHTPEQSAPEPPKKPEPGRPGAGQRKPARQDRRIAHLHTWMHTDETTEERQAKLQETARRVAEQVEQHIRSGQRSLLVANIAPGVGKSSTVAPLGIPGAGLNLAWIAERKDMVSQVEALSFYRQIQACTRHNCPDGHHLHNALGERGYNAWSVHRRHGLQCHYAQQFTATGSAMYQLAHVRTRYPTNHEGIVIDELDVTKWLPEREMNLHRIAAAARLYIDAPECTANLLLRAVEATVEEAARAKRQLHGKELFEALDRRSGGQLANWIGELDQSGKYTNTHPWYEIQEEDEAAQALETMTLAPVVLPHILVALIGELPKWQRGQAWNSCLRIGPGAHGHALYITERLRFSPGEAGLPARAILDATADAEILARLTGEQIQLERAEIEPPPGTRHIAIRTGKRYGKMSLCTKRKDGSPNRDLARAIAEARYILREEDPDGEERQARRIGIISFMGCVDAIGAALDIPQERRLHFWAARGSNALQDCTLLLVIGTPTVHGATVARLARALYQDDPDPISEESTQDAQGIRRYVDPRMQRVNDYLTRAELTQCAHRSRALRQARTVITFCLDSIDYLPPTETVTDLPQLTAEGRERWTASRQVEREKLQTACRRLEEEGRTIHMLTVRELKAAAEVSTDAAADYLRQARSIAQQSQSDDQAPATHTHTHTVFSSVPDNPNGEIYSKVRYNPPPETNAPPAPRRAGHPGTATSPPECGEACIRCGQVDDWARDPVDQRWICSCYYWWYEHPEWRGGGQQTRVG